jgi:monoamine oxidase
MSETFDLIIVGAGFAGVTAAREASNRGLRTVVLEARDRIGGRTWLANWQGTRVELGGTWVHRSEVHLWSEMTRYGIGAVEDRPAEAIYARIGGELRRMTPDDAMGKVLNAFDRICEPAAEVFPRPLEPLYARDALAKIDGQTMRERFDELDFTDEERDLVSGLLSFCGGARMEDIGVTMLYRWYALAGGTAPNLFDFLARDKLKGGTGALIEAIAADSGAEIRLEQPVGSIVDSGEGVTVVTDNGDEYRAPAVIVAVPVNVWPAIDFSPSLTTAKMEAATEGVGVPHGAKLFARLRGEVEWATVIQPEDQVITLLLQDQDIEGDRIVMGFSADPNLDQSDDEQVRGAFEAIYPDNEIVAVMSQPWVDDPYSRGGWTFHRPGQHSRLFEQMAADEGRIVFATADIANTFAGCIDGAIETGLTASRRAAAIIGRTRDA